MSAAIPVADEATPPRRRSAGLPGPRGNTPRWWRATTRTRPSTGT